LAGLTVAVAGLALAAVVPAWADDEEALSRVSVAADGRQGNGASTRPVISGDGRIAAFNTNATNLVTADFDGLGGVLVKDLTTGVISRIAAGLFPTLSHDGRYVAFQSGSASLVPGDTNGKYDVFVHDRQENTTKRVSVASDGTQGNAESQDPSISADGRYVVFTSPATTLAPGATGTNRKIFRHDLETATTIEVSVRPDGTSAIRDSNSATVSGDGRFVAFASQARDLVPGSTTLNLNSAYVRDLQDGTTRRLPSGFVKGSPTISADGRYVAYMDSRSGLVPEDTNGFTDVFRFDLTTGEVIRVNVAGDGTPADKDSGVVPQGVPLSADGRYVLFESGATNLVADDTNTRRDAFVRDTVAGTTTRISANSTTGGTSAGNYVGGISDDGGAAVFSSELSLQAADTNARTDVYLWQRP
jgi:Tol biopolymer transport system component